MTIAGEDLDDVASLYFSSPGIAAKPLAEKSGKAVAGKFVVTVGSDVAPGLYDVRAIGRYGISNPRTLWVDAQPVIAIKPGNTSPRGCPVIPMGSAVFMTAEGNAVQFFRLDLKKDERVRIAVSAAALESKMEPIVELADSSGSEIALSRNEDPLIWTAAADGPVLVKIHDVLYRGGQDYFYRLGVTPESSPAQVGMMPDFSFVRWPVPPGAAFLDFAALHAPTAPGVAPDKAAQARHLEPPCVAWGHFGGRAEEGWYSFNVPEKTTYWIEVISNRLGEPTAPMLLVQRLEKDAAGQIKPVDVTEAYEAPPAGPAEFPASSHDPAAVKISEAGNYRLMVRDLFHAAPDDRGCAYRLEIRRESPDFQLVAIPASPLPESKEVKDVPISTTFLRRDGVTPIRVVAERRDGFAGEINIQVQGLPQGVTAAPAKISADASSCELMLIASADASAWSGPIAITGSSKIGDEERSHAVRPAVISWSVYDKNAKLLDRLRPRLSAAFMIAVSGSEDSPLSIVPANDRPIEVPIGGKISIPFKLVRRADISGPISLKLAGHPLLAKAKEITVDAKADSGSIDLDLGQTKLPAGEYLLHLEAQAKVKYSKKDAASKSAAPATDVTASFYSTTIPVTVLEKRKPTKQGTANK